VSQLENHLHAERWSNSGHVILKFGRRHKTVSFPIIRVLCFRCRSKWPRRLSGGSVPADAFVSFQTGNMNFLIMLGTTYEHEGCTSEP